MNNEREFRISNRACPECGARLVAAPLVDFQSEYACPECRWRKVFDPRADEHPTELGWYNQ